MTNRSFPLWLAALVLAMSSNAFAQAPATAPAQPAAPPPAPPAPPYAAILKDSKEKPGLISLHVKENNLYAELSGGDYNSDFIVLISIARGIGRGQLLGGMTWGFGDDWVWRFRKVDEKVHVIRKNVRFRAKEGSPEATAVQFAYTDSVLFSLPIMAKGPKGGDLIDLTQVFMSDLPQIGPSLPGFSFSPQKSTWAFVKGFKDNVELEVAATYASGGQVEIDEVPDSRGLTINVHYSISKLPQGGYQPRLADDRVGYFLTVVKDFSKPTDRDRFIRYINRWKLEKPDGAGDGPTEPKEKITFYIEKTVPYKYRKPVFDGISEWNRAFEKAGWINAIEVRQQNDDDNWDPEDINYNTFRWITAGAGFAMGPSRVNPYTGQILDADIIFDADFLQFWKEEFETITPQAIAAMTGGSIDPQNETVKPAAKLFSRQIGAECLLSQGTSMQFAFGTAALMANADPKQLAEQQERLIMQGLKEVTMHEVGHTLGLRHNFKASTIRGIKDMNDPEKIKDGMVGSVMDYNPANIVPKDWKQGDYYPTTLGPYDIWAIQYGYTPLDEQSELNKIASRSGEPMLIYATDEDTTGLDPDPTSNRFDLGGDAFEFAEMRAKIVQDLMPGMVDRMTKEGDNYVQARRTFNILLSQHGQAMHFATRYVGGMYTSRSHKGDKDAKPPVIPVEVKKQRDALALLENQVFSAKSYQFPPEIYQYLAISRWSHWGTDPARRKDFEVHNMVSLWQERILSQLLSSITLTRIHDAELKTSPDQDVLTTAELIERLTKSIFSEVETVKEGEFTNRKPAINSLRRNLQRTYLSRISNLAMGRSGGPQDCQTVAYAELASLDVRIGQLLKSPVKFDSYTKAHLEESSSRIKKVLDAKLSLTSP